MSVLGLLRAREQLLPALEHRAAVERAAARRAARDLAAAARRKLTGIDALTASFVGGLVWGSVARREKTPRAEARPRRSAGWRLVLRLLRRLATSAASTWLVAQAVDREPPRPA